jgi:hypothetical protein
MRATAAASEAWAEADAVADAADGAGGSGGTRGGFLTAGGEHATAKAQPANIAAAQLAMRAVDVAFELTTPSVSRPPPREKTFARWGPLAGASASP